MQLIPAIDIQDGRCVRLLRGDFSTATTYADDPLAPAHRYAQLGAPLIHVVDLDGAREGRPVNVTAIRRLGRLCRVQTGGGLRSTDDVAAVLGSGAARAVIGSIAVTEPELTQSLLRRFGGERMVLALDVRNANGGYCVATHGWTVDTQVSLDELLERYAKSGLVHVLVTDIDRDGALSGPNLDLYCSLAANWPQLAVQASGGIRDAADLAALANSGVAAAISGKALLEGRIAAGEMRPYLQSA